MADKEWNGDGGGGRYRRLVEEAPEVVMVLGPDLVVRYASPAVGRILGLDPHSVVGNAFPVYLHPEDGAWARDAFSVLGTRGCGSGSQAQPRELRVRQADGSWRWFEAVAANLLDDPSVGGVAVYLHDVTEKKKLRDQLAYRAFHDPLTGLPNRALFEDRLDHAFARAGRHRGSVTVLFVDLDDFKAVNDGFGHKVGDTILMALGRRLEACLRPGDTVARLGGDEFAVLLEDGDDPMGAARATERLAHALREPVAAGEYRLFVTASVGGATGEPGRDGAEDLLKKADAAMYQAKKAGKNRFKLFDRETSEGDCGCIWFEHDLKGALERGELEVHFQPGVDLCSGKIVGMEALLRWEHPWGEPISPAKIVALAEMSGLIGSVGHRVLERVCRQGFLWQERYPDDPPLVSVNLSARQFCQPALADDVAEALRISGLDPGNLALEVEECFSVEDAPPVTLTVEKLRALGVRLVADNFGRGRSSLSYLGRSPVDLLKIGRSFVGQLGRDEDGVAKLVRAMIGFARAMDIRTVASGVETAEQTASLHEMGCEQAQGFYFFEPVPADAATRLLDSDRGVA
ncbi:MAG: EAL domain-containing protein [Rubrobacter sp.]